MCNRLSVIAAFGLDDVAGVEFGDAIHSNEFGDASPVVVGSLSTTGPLPSLAYDAHGNTTRLADQLLGYDMNDNHITTTLDDGTVIAYLRDASGSIIQRTETPDGGTAQVVRYTAGAVLDGDSDVVQRTVVDAR